MGDSPADSQRPSSPRRQTGMKGRRVNPSNPSEGSAAGKLDHQGVRTASFSRGPGSPIGPSSTLPSGAGLISAIARSVAGSDGPGARSQNARPGEPGWESTPSPREIANQLIADKVASPHPALRRASQQPSDALLHESGLGRSTLALLAGENSLANQDVSNEPALQSLDHGQEGNGPASAAGLFGLDGRGSAALGAIASAAGLLDEHGRHDRAGRSGPSVSPDLGTDWNRLEGVGSRFDEPTGLTDRSRPARVDEIADSRTARPGLLPGEIISSSTTGTWGYDPVRSQDNSRVETQSSQPGGESDHFVSHSGTGRPGIPIGFDQAAVDFPDYRSIHGPWSSVLPAGGASSSADDPTFAGRTGGGETQVNFTKTNELLQQILDELKKEKRSYLRMTDRNDNSTFEH